MQISPIQQRALELEMQGCTPKEIAEHLRRKPRTIQNWQYTEDYKQAQREFLNLAREETLRQLKAQATKAAKCLVELLSATKETNSGILPDCPTRLAAAKEILNRVLGKPAEQRQADLGNEEPLLIRLAPSQFLRTNKKVEEKQ